MNGSSGGDEGRGDLERPRQSWQDKTITALKEVSMPQRAGGCCDWLKRNSPGDVDPLGKKPGWWNLGFRKGIECGEQPREIL